MEIKNKVIIITGASRGIGAATAVELSKRGAKLVLAARDTKKLEAVATQVPGALVVATDVTNPADVKALIAKTKEKFGHIDVLINNAGRGLRAPLEKIDMKEYRAIMDLNVFAVLTAMQEVIPLMRVQGGGTIVNISSLVSKNYFTELSAYASTKYALNALSLTAREELKNDGIVVSVFHPKMTATDFGANALGTPYVSSAGRPGMTVDTSEQVAMKIVDLIESGDAEAMM